MSPEVSSCHSILSCDTFPCALRPHPLTNPVANPLSCVNMPFSRTKARLYQLPCVQKPLSRTASRLPLYLENLRDDLVPKVPTVPRGGMVHADDPGLPAARQPVVAIIDFIAIHHQRLSLRPSFPRKLIP